MLREAGVPDVLASRLEPAQRILVEAIAQRRVPQTTPRGLAKARRNVFIRQFVIGQNTGRCFSARLVFALRLISPRVAHRLWRQVYDPASYLRRYH
jgi:hypothetical protein